LLKIVKSKIQIFFLACVLDADFVNMEKRRLL